MLRAGLFLLFIWPIWSPLVSSKVDPPNYNFGLEQLNQFRPGSTKEDIEKSNKNGEIIEQRGERAVVKYYVAHLRYKFPIFVQFYQGKVLDYYARLPQYFLHDVFHQSLINRFGKQNKYFKKEESALYEWENKENMKIIYQGACTITCFPIYLTMITMQPPSDIGSYRPLIETFKTNL
ncbi:MAG: hypothetical protein HYV97_17330 [Bdellovibrio sp.]|nr:hypothetical protein [Bdellovibrio sp.]